MKIEARLAFEKDAPKSHAYGVRTDEGILIKVWIPKALVRNPPEDIVAGIAFATGDGSGKKKSKKRKQRDEDDDEEA